jgi:uncharacterized membrane protein YraQ (UPF0718 family)
VRNDTLLTNMDDSSPQQPGPHSGWQANRVWLLLGVLAVVWWIIWDNLERTANWLTFDVIGLAPGTALGDALAFFLYDVPKILLLLTGMIFLVSTLRTFFSVERTRQLLGGKRQGVGNVLAALLGVVTPFCSCSAVPLFIGFVEAGIPLGVTFSFLIAAPMLFGLFGWQVAALYMGTGLLIAIVAGVIIGRVPNVEHGVEDFVWKISVGSSGMEAGDRMNWSERFAIAWQTTREIVGKVWLFVIAGIAVGAFIHGFVPENALAAIMGKDAWWSVPAAVAIGVPMYSNAAGIIPVTQALMAKGASLGTVLAFMMSVVALSLPEMIAVFVGVVSLGIVLIGYLFNLII